MAWKKRQLLAYLDRVEPAIERLTHFELLDINSTAGDHEIREAFHQMASRLHPDLYRSGITERDHERLNIVYGRIAQAYMILRDPDERKKYVRTLAREKPAVAEGQSDLASAVALLSPKAQRHYRRAEAALRTGNKASAVLSLRMALASDPKSSFLREQLANAQKK
jgi:DnaJ-class molecular chaperone